MAQILVAEDDAQLRNFLVRMLQRAGYRVRAAENGSQAVEMLAEIKVDLLLADVTMPGLDGFELAKQCSRHNPNVQIMFITGFAAVSLKRNRPVRGSSASRSTGNGGLSTPSSNAGSNPTETAAPRLSKPFHLNHLIQEVGRLLYA
ncbi:MAG TPA: response regulator [Terriglobales bacterium]|nr:response regulator [Terriglobales bacterium]